MKVDKKPQPSVVCLFGFLLSFLFTSKKEAWTTSLKFKPSAMVAFFCMYVYVYRNILFLINVSRFSLSSNEFVFL